ncbi:putative Phage-related protein [Magnetospirillum sp. XM-1]|uniref:host specificity factor TipJ family phage tail protein n=1 Tax=Magnetospirillum sp. XM-1 TaxID=1663591 RepID=UPI00073DF387|nr:host specificity factor TipJ family phage tail protein [Magnetospirillum sp. XM-1]CUW39665.1 putative Phage-related protein [Magnetospirillum sp. XM-1]
MTAEVLRPIRLPLSTGVVVMVANAFQPERGRAVLPVAEPITVRGFLAERGIDEFPLPTICLFNGEPLLRADWESREIRQGDLCAFVALPHGGGGGGGGGKNPMRTVLMIAVMVAAIYTGGLLAPYIGSAFAEMGVGLTWEMAAGIGTAVVGMAGTALVSALVPAPRPSTPDMNWGGFGSTPAPSPTYSLQSQGNSARLGQPIPVIYGRHLVYPDIATAPFDEFVDNEQYLHQLHLIGQGEYVIEKIRIEDTPLSSFEEVQYEVVPPGGTVTLFEADVVSAPEVAGQELQAPNTLSTGEDGYVGPFAANPVDTEAGHLGIDVIFGRGLYYANNSGGLDSKTIQWQVEYRPIDSDGTATGSWTVLATESVTAATNTVLRKSYKYAVTPGRYEVQAKRLDNKDTDSRAGHEIRWNALRSYLVGTPDFGDVTLLAVKMRATDNLSQRSSRLINCLVTRKIPVWSPTTGWSAPQATRSIAWAFADVCRASYGAKLPDSRIDLAALHALDAVWEARGDRFDAVFDSSLTVWEALTRIARCGRAAPILQGGAIRVVRDEPQTIPVAMFGPRNIVKNSLKIQYIMPSDDTADAVTVSYFSDRTWKPDEVTAKLPDSAAENPAKVSLFGCTAKEHALREGDFIAADNRYRRKMVSFRTELDGMIPTFGDLIAITHDMPRWGHGGEVVDWDTSGNAGTGGSPSWQDVVMTLSEPMEWTEGSTHYIALRRRDGRLAGPFEVEAVTGEDFQVRFLEPMTVTPYTGSDEERTYFSFGPGEKWTQLARVRSIKPRADQVEVSAVAEDSRVHVN